MGRPDGAGHGHGSHGANDFASAPASGYGAPAQSYEPAAQSYSAPASDYASPSSGYGVSDDASYGVSGYGAEEGGFDISTLIIPLLIIAGLSLLFPTITTVSVRKKRHAEGKKHTTFSSTHPATHILLYIKI